MTHDRIAELETQIAYLVAVVDISEDAVLTLDTDGCVTSWNRAAQRLFGFSESLVRGFPFAGLVAEHDFVAWERRMARVLTGRPLATVDVSVRRRGTLVPTRVAAEPVRDGNGGVLGVSLVVRDVEEQRFAQTTLAESAQRVAESEALAHVGSWAWDVMSDAVQWSEGLHRIHGVVPGEFDGTLAGHLERVLAIDRPDISRAMQAALSNDSPFDQEFRVVRPDRSVRWVQARATLVVGPAGAGLGLRGIYHDITERHERAQVERDESA